MSKIVKAAILSILISFLPVKSLLAQGFGGGLSLGMNAAQINGDGVGGFNKVGLNAGLLVKRKLNNSFSWQFELLYSRKGSKTKVDTNSSGAPSRFFHNRLTYVEVPVLLNWNIYERFRIQAGICFGILNTASTEDIYGIVSDKTKMLYRTDYNSVIGVEYDLSDRFSANLRYTNSLINISQNPPKWWNIVTTFSIRYNLRK